MEVGFIGNFIPPYSTENDRKWSLLKLGHNVVKFQENKTAKLDLVRWVHKLDVLFYSHTHDPDYVIGGLKDIFELYKERGVPTVSVHLDKWAGLERAKDVGKEATWFTEYVFMADCSPDAVRLYKKHNINYKYLPAGVVERDCYIAPPDSVRFPHEIVFIGSKGYHPEYPFRKTLVEWLEKTYGQKFGHYGGDGLGVVRGHDLNVLCSTAKLVVGDSCFGGQDFYVSDRYFEIRGRGGLLLHPHVKGVDTVGVVPYEKGNLDSLKKVINGIFVYPEYGEFMRKLGHEFVKENDTYTQRMKRIFEMLGL